MIVSMNETILQLINQSKYISVFLGALLEGPAVALASGVLVKSQVLQFIPTILVHAAGDVTGDLLYFFASRLGGSAILRWLKVLLRFSDSHAYFMKHIVKKYHGHIIFSGKLTHFLGIPAIMSVGFSQYSWKKFVILDTIATLIKSSALVTAGYSLGFLWPEEEYMFSMVAVSCILLVAIVFYLYQIRKDAE